MFVAESGSTSHMVNSLKNMTNLQELTTLVKTRNKKTTTELLQDNWKGYQKIDGKNYLVMSTDTAYMPDLSANIFSMPHTLTKGFNKIPEKEILVLKKNATILKFEEHLYHGNGYVYLFSARLYASLNDTGNSLRREESGRENDHEVGRERSNY